MDTITKIVRDIGDIKIQGATNIARSSLLALKKRHQENPYRSLYELKLDLDKLKSVRLTEPLTQNILNLILYQMDSQNKLTELPALIDVIVSKLDDVKGEIVKNGVSLIEKIYEAKNRQPLSIFTHCHSSIAIQTLIEAQRRGVSLGVYHTETRPIFQGRLTARDLIAANISTTMITDSEAGFLLSQESKISIDMILLGADAVSMDGDVYNKVGSYSISLSAKKEHIPLFITTTLLKVSGTKIRIEQRNEDEVWPNHPPKLKILNPAFDTVPSRLITRLITEFGLIQTTEIKKFVKKNYPWIFTKADTENLKISQKKESRERPYLSYLHLGEKVKSNNHLLATFRLVTEGDASFREIAGGIAAESSVGTWTKVTTQFRRVWEQLHARVIEADKKTGYLKVAYPLDLFEPGNIPQLLASVAGNIYGLKEVHSLKLLDLEMPEIYVESYPGPSLGLPGIRKLTQVFDQPLLGSIIKPKEGLNFKQHAELTIEVYRGGLNFVKDDENLTSQVFNPFDKRLRMITKLGKKNIKNWQQRIYAFNISSDTAKMRKRAEMVKSYEGNCIMIDILTVGFASVQYIRNKNYGLVIHAHRAMHAALTRDPSVGMTMMVIAKLARLAGVDSLHTGTVVGKMEGGQAEVTSVNNFLRSDWYGLKSVLPVASGGLYPNLIPDLMRILGEDMLFNFGGGIHGHPDGSQAGARAVVQAVEAVKHQLTLEEYGKTHRELEVAINHFR